MRIGIDSIELPEEQAKKLEEIARQERVSVEEVVSRAITEMLEARERKRAELWALAAELDGKFDSGVNDLSERHDDYLNEGRW